MLLVYRCQTAFPIPIFVIYISNHNSYLRLRPNISLHKIFVCWTFEYIWGFHLYRAKIYIWNCAGCVKCLFYRVSVLLCPRRTTIVFFSLLLFCGAAGYKSPNMASVPNSENHLSGAGGPLGFSVHSRIIMVLYQEADRNLNCVITLSVWHHLSIVTLPFLSCFREDMIHMKGRGVSKAWWKAPSDGKAWWRCLIRINTIR